MDRWDREEVLNSLKFLKSIGITVDDIRKQPTILLSKEFVLRNRHKVFLECGCSYVNAFILNKYLILTNHTEDTLKMMGIIENEINLQQRLADILNVTLHHPCKIDVPLKRIREHILRMFYEQNKLMTAEEFDEAIEHYPNVGHIPYRSIKEMTELLVDQIQMPKETFKDNLFVFHSDPDNVRKLLTMKPIGGVEMKDILRTMPTLMLTSYKNVNKTMSLIKKFGITEKSITKCFRVLKVDSQIVEEQLEDLSSRKELQAMTFHPDYLKLTLNTLRTQARLDYLNQIDKKCVSVHVLTTSPKIFLK